MDFLELMEAGDKLEMSVSDVRQRIENFDEKLVGFIDLINNKRGYRKAMHRAMLQEAESTADFPYLFGTVLDRTLYAKYKNIVQDWREYVKTGTQNDFRPSWLIGVNGLQGSLPAVPLQGAYPSDAALVDGKVGFALNKYGREYGLAWETVINDDLGAFTDIPERYATAAARSEYRFATALYASATGPNTSLYGAPIAHPLYPAGSANSNVTNLFSSSNKVNVVNADGTVTATTPAFSIDTLSAACSAMRRFVDYDGEPVMIDGFELVVPPALEIRMLQALNPANIIQSGGDSAAGVKGQIRSSSNTAAQLNITGHVNPYLPLVDLSANNNKTWYLFAKLSSGYAVRMNFLRGHETPEICMKNPNKITLGGASMSPMEGDYESDSLRWRLRHIFGGKQIDPNMSAAFVGA